MAEYQLYLYDVWGQRVSVISHDQIEKLVYVKTTNAVGALTLTLPRAALPDAAVVADARIEVWRKPDSGSWGREGEAAWLIATDTVGLSDAGGAYRRIKALTANCLLSRRAVMYYANTANTQMTNAADDMMKIIVFQNLLASANGGPTYSAGVTPSRDWTAVLGLDNNLALGPSVTKGFAWRSVLSVLQEIARDTATAGTPVFFDVVLVGSLLTFRTWVGVRGIDRSTGAAQLVVSASRGSLGGTIEKTTDWTDAASWVVAGGQGQNAARLLGSSYDTVRVGQSPFGLREVFVDATSLSDQNSLNADASSELRSRRPAKTLTGSLLSVPGAVYGLDWGWGDKLIAEHEQDAFVATVDSVTVTLDKGAETITAALKGTA